MSVIVKGMEMPKSCWECALLIGVVCGQTGKLAPYKKTMEDCPLIEIPKDAKLVDANELLDKSEWYGERATYDNPMPNGEEAVPIKYINDAVIINTERNREDDNRRSD